MEEEEEEEEGLAAAPAAGGRGWCSEAGSRSLPLPLRSGGAGTMTEPFLSSIHWRRSRGLSLGGGCAALAPAAEEDEVDGNGAARFDPWDVSPLAAGGGGGVVVAALLAGVLTSVRVRVQRLDEADDDGDEEHGGGEESESESTRRRVRAAVRPGSSTAHSGLGARPGIATAAA